MINLTLREGLPATGPLATAFPADWGRLGQEGTVVEFATQAGSWVANFKRGNTSLELAQLLPNGRGAVVVAGGDLWLVDPLQRTAECVLQQIDAAFEVQNPDGWVFSLNGVALARFASNGIVWHTRRLSWDGFEKLSVAQGEVTGLAWTWINDERRPFRVDICTGRSTGGGYSDEDDDTSGWERLAE